jgi:hypothetical protein
MTNCCKVVALMTFLMTLVPVVVFGRFQNEFLRLNIIFSSLLFTFFANEHYIIRLMVRTITLDFMNFFCVIGGSVQRFCDIMPRLPVHARVLDANGMRSQGSV